MFDFWWAYYQCEPFGSEWEQSASIQSMLSGLQSLVAAGHGQTVKAHSVVDFMPPDSVPWKRKKQTKGSGEPRKPRGITDPKLQELAIKRAFGF